MRASLRSGWRTLKEALSPARRVGVAYGDMLPATLPARNLILVEEDAEPWSIGMRCPCGCGETVELPLSPEVEPRWDFIDRSQGQTEPVAVRLAQDRVSISLLATQGARSLVPLKA